MSVTPTQAQTRVGKFPSAKASVTVRHKEFFLLKWVFILLDSFFFFCKTDFPHRNSINKGLNHWIKEAELQFLTFQLGLGPTSVNLYCNWSSRRHGAKWPHGRSRADCFAGHWWPLCVIEWGWSYSWIHSCWTVTMVAEPLRSVLEHNWEMSVPWTSLMSQTHDLEGRKGKLY